MVKVVNTKAEFDEIINAEGAKVAVDFTATWCGPCQMIGPKFAAKAESGDFGDIVFIKVDVDENAETAEAVGIQAMPTFFFYHNGEKVSDLVGANEAKLTEKLNELKAR